MNFSRLAGAALAAASAAILTLGSGIASALPYPPCGATDVTVEPQGRAIENGDEATNTILIKPAASSTHCHIKGVPVALQFTNSMGRNVLTRAEQDNSRPTERVMISKGKVAKIDLRWKFRGENPINPSFLTFSLPDASGTLRVPWEHTVADGGLFYYTAIYSDGGSAADTE